MSRILSATYRGLTIARYHGVEAVTLDADGKIPDTDKGGMKDGSAESHEGPCGSDGASPSRIVIPLSSVRRLAAT
jgi:hypothetical protein